MILSEQVLITLISSLLVPNVPSFTKQTYRYTDDPVKNKANNEDNISNTWKHLTMTLKQDRNELDFTSRTISDSLSVNHVVANYDFLTMTSRFLVLTYKQIYRIKSCG